MSGPESKAVNSDWSKGDLRKLFAAMKEIIPTDCSMCSYNKTLGAMDWTKVAFPPFSPETCKTKWREISLKIRKFRYLTELIDEAENGLQCGKLSHFHAKETETGVSKKLPLNLPSDSEDDEIEYSNSEEEEVSQELQEGEAEEEDGDIMFDIY